MSENETSESEIALSEAIRFGIRAHQQGQREQAEEIFRRVLEVWPECPDALHFSGLLAFQKNDRERALLLLEKSLVLAPEHPGFWNNFGNVQREWGEKARASEAYRRAIELEPAFADAHNNLGVMASQQGDFSAAVESYRTALGYQPNHPDFHLNLGRAYENLEMLDDAVTAYRTTADLLPNQPEAYGRLGHILWQQGKKQEAIEAIIANTELEPGNPMAFIVLGHIFFEQGRQEESIDAYRKAAEADPKHNTANRLLGIALARNGRTLEAREVWRKWSEADPENPVPKHHLQAGNDDQIPARAGNEFVVHEFDRFADSFDKQLRHLQYKAPELVIEELQKRFPAPDGSLEILDAGCGTGLCGPLLRPFASRLAGVDLSPKMVEKAKKRGGYDELIVGELTSFIASKKSVYDVIASADTLCYFGRLEEVLSAVAEALQKNGCFIFTVEKTLNLSNPARVTLDNSGRYTHSEEYVRTSVAQAGLELERLVFTTLRMECFVPVEGMVVVARKKPEQPEPS